MSETTQTQNGTLLDEMTAMYMRECRHFDGIRNGPCKAGVNYLSVRHDDLPLAQRFPCRCPETSGCDKAAYNSVVEARAIAMAMLNAVDSFVARSEAGLCGHCGAAVERREKVGQCVYVRPCGHRQGIGA